MQRLLRLPYFVAVTEGGERSQGTLQGEGAWAGVRAPPGTIFCIYWVMVMPAGGGHWRIQGPRKELGPLLGSQTEARSLQGAEEGAPRRAGASPALGYARRSWGFV